VSFVRSGGDELEEEGRGVGVEGDVADFVDDEERDAAEAFQLVGEAAGAFGFSESEHPVGGRRERDSVAAAGGLDAESDAEMRLAGAGWPQEDHVVGLAQEVELVEMGDLLVGDGPLVGEVEVVEGLDLWKPDGFDSVLATVGFTRCDFFGEDLG